MMSCLPVLCGACLLVLVGCSGGRAELPRDELYQRLERAGAANIELIRDMHARIGRTLDADVAAGRKPSIDILSLSGGGDWGAYGAGFLRAWSQIPADDPRAMPDFDLITGISTGALIAPYAYLGMYDRVDDLYRGSSTDWARGHTLYGLISGNALYDISGLEERIREELAHTLAPALRAKADQHRSLVVATADLDLGLLRLWDLQAVAADSERIYQVQRAAIAIPAAFEPVLIDGTLQADAGVLMQLIAVGRVQGMIDALETWNRAHPGTPARLRYWVVVNNRTHEPPTTVQPTWHGSLIRTSNMMLKAGVIAPLKNLALRVQVLRNRGIDAEFNWTAIPPDFPIDETLNPFDPRTTCSLSDLGRRVALSPTPWQEKAPLYLQHEVDDGSGLDGP
jgi:hypothetical protein